MMSETDFREDVRAAIRKHGQDLDGDDLRELARDLEDTADRWDSLEVSV